MGEQKANPRKSEIARRLIENGDFGVSFQVLQEFFVNAKKPNINAPDDVIDAWISNLLEFDCDVGDVDLFLDAIDISRRYKISYWDSAIVASASRLGAKTLYTEDLSHGQDYGPVKVLNPFL